MRGYVPSPVGDMVALLSVCTRRVAAAMLAASCLQLDRSPATALSSTTTCAWESWVYGGSVDQAVREVRSLLIRNSEAKITSQSPDRRYMRVRFENYDLRGQERIDDCQFYLVPTGAQGSAAVVQCRRGPSDADAEDNARSRRRVRDLRNKLEWTARASGEGDAFKSFSVLDSMFAKVPLGQQACHCPLQGGLRAKAARS